MRERRAAERAEEHGRTYTPEVGEEREDGRRMKLKMRETEMCDSGGPRGRDVRFRRRKSELGRREAEISRTSRINERTSSAA